MNMLFAYICGCIYMSVIVWKLIGYGFLEAICLFHGINAQTGSLISDGAKLADLLEPCLLGSPVYSLSTSGSSLIPKGWNE